MDTIEIIILCFVILLSIISIIYVSYFQYVKVSKIKAQIDDGGFSLEDYKDEKNENKIRKIITLVICGIYFVFSLSILTTSLVFRFNSPMTINDQYIVSIESSSMASNHPSNYYLINNKVESKLYVHDLIAFDKVDENTEYQLMDIILYKGKVDNEEVLIAHRLLKIDENGDFILRGDANIENDPIVKKQDIIGIYSHRLEFLSFMNYIANLPATYVVLGAIIVSYVIIDSSNIYIKNKIKKSDN